MQMNPKNSRQMLFKTTLITGASSGLGAALARKLAARSASLLLTARNEENLRHLADELGSLARVDYMACDLKDSRAKLLEYIEQHAPDLVINCAGYTVHGECLDHLAEQQKILTVNALAPYELTLHAARALKAANQKGVIVNISSTASLLPFPRMTTYAAAKAFLASFSQSFDAEMRPYGIRILVTLPGPILTSFAAKASGREGAKVKSSLAMSVEQAADLIIDQIDRRKGYAIIDWRSRIAMFFMRLMPRSYVAAKLNKGVKQLKKP
jgi:uncharacterized protein